MSSRSFSSWVATIAWACLGAVAVIVVSGFTSLSLFGLAELTRGGLLRFLFVILVVCVFLLLYQLAKAAWSYSPSLPPPIQSAPRTGEAFPSPSTNLTFAWLLIFAVGSICGVLVAANPPTGGWLFVLISRIAVFPSDQINEALVMIFAAGVGSAITTLLAFLRHASNEKNFDRAQLPWYVARPLNGMMLGLVFYFLIRGGLLLTIGGSDTATQDLNVWGLAGIGSLVGLFSKNAIDKLREIFHVIFQTEGDVRRQLGETPEDTRKKLLELLPDSVKSILMFGTSSQIEEALRSLPDDVKKKLRAELPESMLKVLEPFLDANLLQKIRSLPSEEQEALLKALPEPAKSAHLKGDNETLEKALLELNLEQKISLEKAVSEQARKILIPHLGLDLLARIRAAERTVWEKVYEALPEAAQAAWLDNDTPGLIAALQALDDSKKKVLESKLPDEVKGHFADYLKTKDGAPPQPPADAGSADPKDPPADPPEA